MGKIFQMLQLVMFFFVSIIASLEILKNRRWLYMHISYFSLDKIYNTLNLVW